MSFKLTNEERDIPTFLSTTCNKLTKVKSESGINLSFLCSCHTQVLPFYTSSLSLLEKREVDQATKEKPDQPLAEVMHTQYFLYFPLKSAALYNLKFEKSAAF